MGKYVERTIGELEARFDAALAREEEEAASDLAFSLMQDRSITEAVAGRGVTLTHRSGASIPATVIGSDFAAGGKPLLVARLADVIISPREGPPPQTTDATLLEFVRELARSRGEAEVTAAGTTRRGFLLRVTPDHLALSSPAGEVIVPFGGLEWLRVTRGG